MTFPTDAQAARSDDALRRQLLALAHRWLGQGEDAEDLVQEAYLRAAQGPLPTSGHDAWLTTVLHHLCIDRLRRRGRYRALLERIAQEPRHPWPTTRTGRCGTPSTARTWRRL